VYLINRLHNLKTIYLIDLIYMKHTFTNSIRSLYLRQLPAVNLTIFKYSFIEFFTKKNMKVFDLYSRHAELFKIYRSGFVALYLSKRPCIACLSNILYTYINRIVYPNLKFSQKFAFINYAFHKNFKYFLTKNILKVSCTYLFKLFFKSL
jgi:hypothetical protein